MEGPESVGVESVAGARKVVVRERVVTEELMDGRLERIEVVVNVMFEVPQQKAERVGEVLIHLIQTTIHGLVHVQVVAQGTVNNPGAGNQRKTHLERVLQLLQHRREREAHLPGCTRLAPQGTC